MLDYQRLAVLIAAIRATRSIHGDVIEFGTFQGGSAGVILQELQGDKCLHVCDSFEGMPGVSLNDNYHKRGDFSATSAEKVRAGLTQVGGNFQMHVGYFCDTIGKMKEHDSYVFSLVHIDSDLYESILEALEFVYPRMPEGAIIIFDDYGAPSCLGAKKAVDEFFLKSDERIIHLSGPQFGCVVGGGDIFEKLGPEFTILNRVPGYQKRVFG